MVKMSDRFWIYEDELPEDYPYDEMFEHSRVFDGVRMFPNCFEMIEFIISEHEKLLKTSEANTI